MLTVKQPPTYGYKSVHDLPTPPSTSRPSPPLIYQEYSHKTLPVIPRNSPPSQPMSAPHRGLPPPAAMALPPQQPPTTGAPPPTHHVPPPPSLTQSHQSHQSHQQRDSWGQLPAPPHQWQGAEESMRNWLQARTEEDKRRQEEEKTRQESLRLEQRKVEMDMLRTSLSSGIPPAMVPLVFAGMGSGGILPQAALEWAQQFMPPSQQHHPQLMPPQPVSPEHQRDPHAPAHGQYHGIPSSQGAPPPPPPPPAYAYPGSPTRPRGQTVVGTMGRPMAQVSNLPSLNTNIPQLSHGAPSMAHPQMQQAQPPQHESQQSSPSIYFHHWQPPTSQASSSNRPGTPSGETPRKRKATGQPAPSPTRGDSRFRSPPPFVQSSLSNPSRARRGHTRQRSDMSSYRSSEPGRSRRESFGGPLRGLSPIRSSAPVPSLGLSHERGSSERERSESQKHSVSSMLSEEPRPASQQSAPPLTGERSEKRQRQTPPTDPQAHGGFGESGHSREGEVEGDGAREGM